MKSMSVALLVVVALLLCGLLWVVLRDGDRLTADAALEAVAPGDREVTLLPDGADDGARTDEPKERIPLVEPALEDEFVPAPTAAGDGIQLLVLEGEGDEPVPAAEVCARLAVEARPISQPSETFPGAIDGAWRRCDDEGRAVIPGSRDELRLAAREGGRWAQTTWEPGMEEPVVLRLVPDRTLRVRVVDHLGEPRPGVPVSLRVDCRWRRDVVKVFSREPDGVAEIPHVQAAWRDDPECRHFAALALPLSELIEVPVELETIPAEPIELTLPVTGTVEVELLGSDRLPFTYPARVQVRAVDPAAEDGQTVLHLGGDSRVVVSGQRAIFRDVALGLRLQVEVTSRAGYRAPHRWIAGPATPGDTVHHTARLELCELVLTGRLIDPDGIPLCSTPFRVAGQSRFRSLGRSAITDSEGRFHVCLAPSSVRELGSVDFTARPAAGRAPLHVAVPLPTDGELLVVDLGAVLMTESPLLAAGIVVDERGEPIPKVVVQAVENRPPEENRWVPRELRGISTLSRGDGRFALFGVVPTSTVTLVPSHRAYPDARRYPGAVEVGVSSTEVTLALRGAGGLAGSLVVDEGYPPREVDVFPLGARDPILYTADDPKVTADGIFAFHGLAPGVYTVYFHLPGSTVMRDEPLRTVENVLVESGQINRDPRLQGVDLRGLVRMFNVEVVDPDGNRIDCQAEIHEAGKPEGESDWCFGWKESLRIYTRFPAIDLSISAAGFRLRQIHGLDADRTVVLRLGPLLHFRLQDPSVLTGTKAELELVLKRDAESVRAGPLLALDERGEATTRVNAPGRYSLELFVARRGLSTGVLRPVGSDEPRFIEVEDIDEEQSFAIPLTVEELGTALEKLGKK